MELIYFLLIWLNTSLCEFAKIRHGFRERVVKIQVSIVFLIILYLHERIRSLPCCVGLFFWFRVSVELFIFRSSVLLIMYWFYGYTYLYAYILSIFYTFHFIYLRFFFLRWFNCFYSLFYYLFTFLPISLKNFLSYFF